MTQGRQSDTVNVMYALTSQHIIACPHRPHFPPTLPPPSPAGAPPNTRQTPKAQSTPPRLALDLSPHSSTSSQHRCGPSLPRRVAGPANPGPHPPPPTHTHTPSMTPQCPTVHPHPSASHSTPLPLPTSRVTRLWELTLPPSTLANTPPPPPPGHIPPAHTHTHTCHMDHPGVDTKAAALGSGGVVSCCCWWRWVSIACRAAAAAAEFLLCAVEL